MYRRTNKYRKKVTGSYTNRSKKEQLLEYTEDVRPVQVIPNLRRVIEITDYDSGQPVEHRIELRKCDRIDCYDKFVDGELWKRRVRWSNIITGSCKAMLSLARE
jgi:hypothetical protein